MTFTDLLPELANLDRADKIRAMQLLITELAKEEPKFSKMHIDSELLPANDLTDEIAAFYHAKLRPLLEPFHNGESVAIHVESRSYEVAKGPGHAYRALRAKMPSGSIIVHKIGIADAGFEGRMLGERFE